MFAIIIVFIVLTDQLSKLAVLNYFFPNSLPAVSSTVSPIVIKDGVFEINYIGNRGAFFGSFADSRWVFMIISTVAIIAMLVYLIKMRKSSKLLIIALSFLIGGGIGNMIDRFRLGFVVDFIYAKFIDFAKFNVADSFITIGAGLLILYLIRLELAERKVKKEAAVDNSIGEQAESTEVKKLPSEDNDDKNDE